MCCVGRLILLIYVRSSVHLPVFTSYLTRYDPAQEFWSCLGWLCWQHGGEQLTLSSMNKLGSGRCSLCLLVLGFVGGVSRTSAWMWPALDSYIAGSCISSRRCRLAYHDCSSITSSPRCGPSVSAAEPWPRQRVVCWGRKRKGNKKNRTAEDHGDDDDDYDDGPQWTPRVTSNINVPVRHQIAAVRRMKQAMKQEAKPPPSKTKVKKKETGQRKAVAGDLPYIDPEVLASKTILLVDGYNVIASWSKTIKARSAGGNAQARATLAEQLRYLVAARRWKVVVAYDEHSPGSILRVIDEGDVEEVYTGESESADAYIEKRARELCKKGNPSVMVASDDRSIQVVSMASGAQTISTSRLIQEIYTARKEIQFRMRGDQWWGDERRFDDADDYFDYSRD